MAGRRRRQGSHLTRGAWIETIMADAVDGSPYVAPHTRCVD
ncbi:hypothetical protein HMPREF3038_03195 [Akkermansia sp. KLE1797]|nr:hypothetical protein HMPREF3038_03195 [Akkermansia sp. KLE1797]